MLAAAPLACSLRSARTTPPVPPLVFLTPAGSGSRRRPPAPQLLRRGSNSTSERLSASDGGVVSSQCTGSVGTARGSDALQNFPAPAKTEAKACRVVPTGNAFQPARRHRNIQIHRVCGNPVDRAALAPEMTADHTNMRTVVGNLGNLVRAPQHRGACRFPSRALPSPLDRQILRLTVLAL